MRSYRLCFSFLITIKKIQALSSGFFLPFLPIIDKDKEMKKIISTILITSCLISSNALALLNDDLPSRIRKALEDAYNTKNSFVIESVIKTSKESYPAYADKIDGYISQIKSDEKAAKTVKITSNKPSKYSGNIDTSFDIANGNTKRADASLSAKLKYKGELFDNTLKFVARNSQEDNIRTNEEYQINNQTNYNFTTRDYSFLELEYVNDRFGGYEFRTSELLGYGHKFFIDRPYNLSGEISAGARQSSLTDGSDSKSVLGKLGLKGDWKITDNITLEQDLTSSFGSDAVITISDTSIKTQIIDSIYLKFNYNFQHIDDVPSGTKHIDSLTSVGIGYQF